MQTLELDMGIGGGELPVPLDALPVASFFPGCDLTDEPLFVRDAPIQVLPSQDGQLTLQWTPKTGQGFGDCN